MVVHEDLEWAIMARSNFEKCLVIIKEALSRTVEVRDTTEVTCHELENQLEKFRMELTAVNKIHAKVEEALVAKNEEISRLNALLMDEHDDWDEERGHTEEISKNLCFV